MSLDERETQPLLGPSFPPESRSAYLQQTEDDVVPPSTPRNLSWASAYIIVVSRVIGTGIFATPGIVLRSVGSTGLAISLWLLGAGIAATELVVWLEYGCMLPQSGGHKVYLEYTYPYPRFLVSTLVAAQAVLLTFSTGNCVVFGEYTLFALGRDPTDFTQKSLAASLLIFVVGTHACFPRTGVAIQNILGWVKVFSVALLALVGVYIVALSRDRGAEAPTVVDGLSRGDPWKGSSWSLAMLSTAMFKVNYSYAGLNNLNNVLNEVENPARTLKRVAPAALVTGCLLYVLINLSYFLVVPIDEIKSSGELTAGLFFERVFGSSLGRTVFSLAIAVSAAGNVMVVIYALGRLNQEIARQRFLPWPHLLSSSKPFRAPLGGLIVHFIPSFLVILLSPSKGIYSFILDLEGYSVQMIVLALSVGLIILRNARPDLKRPFKAWIPAVWFRIMFCILLLLAPFFPPGDTERDSGFFYATYPLVGVAILLLAMIFWSLWTVFIPHWKGWVLEERVDLLDDGTRRTKLVYSAKAT